MPSCSSLEVAHAISHDLFMLDLESSQFAIDVCSIGSMLYVPITILSTTQDTIVLESAASGKTAIRTLPETRRLIAEE